MQVLDHGYVNLVQKGCWGSDELIIEAARMSTNKGFQGWGPLHEEGCPVTGIHVNTERCRPVPGDEKLLKYLWDHKHYTPFEMAGATFEIQAPIFVVREWHRHRTQSYNELSSRYTELPDLYYIPSIERLMAGRQAKSNKQGSAEGFTQHDAELIRDQIHDNVIDCRQRYTHLLAQGVSRELARLVIPVNQYTRFRASANLRNWLAFLTLRLDAGAQWEIREYAGAVSQMIQELFPRTWTLFVRDLAR